MCRYKKRLRDLENEEKATKRKTESVQDNYFLIMKSCSSESNH
jgi:hypothetical protein